MASHDDKMLLAIGRKLLLGGHLTFGDLLRPGAGEPGQLVVDGDCELTAEEADWLDDQWNRIGETVSSS